MDLWEKITKVTAVTLAGWALCGVLTRPASAQTPAAPAPTSQSTLDPNMTRAQAQAAMEKELAAQGAKSLKTMSGGFVLEGMTSKNLPYTYHLWAPLDKDGGKPMRVKNLDTVFVGADRYLRTESNFIRFHYPSLSKVHITIMSRTSDAVRNFEADVRPGDKTLTPVNWQERKDVKVPPEVKEAMKTLFANWDKLADLIVVVKDPNGIKPQTNMDVINAAVRETMWAAEAHGACGPVPGFGQPKPPTSGTGTNYLPPITRGTDKITGQPVF